MSKLFFDPQPQFTDNNGNPLSSGTVGFYESGTSTLKAVYTDSDLTIPATNPMVLDAGGFVRSGGVYLGSGDYKIVIKSQDETITRTIDPYTGLESNSGLFASYSSIQDLKDVSDPTNDQLVYVSGYYSNGDGGEGWFYFNSSSTDSDNLGTIISPTGAPATGRWIRIVPNNEVTPPMFGAVSGATISASSAFSSMIGTGYNILIPKGSYLVDGTINFNDGDYRLKIDAGATFYTNNVHSGSITIRCRFECLSKTALINTNQSLSIFSDGLEFVMPEWWGAVGDGTTNDFNSLNKIIVSNSPIMFTGVYAYTTSSVVTKAVNKMIFQDGSYLFPQLGAGYIQWNIDEIETLGADQIFRGVTNRINITSKQYKVSWFDIDSIVDETKYDYMTQSVSLMGTRIGSLVWDTGKTHTFTTFAFNADYEAYITNDVQAGTFLTFSSDCSGFFGAVIDKPYSFINCNGFVNFYNKELKINWFVDKAQALVTNGITVSKPMDLCGNSVIMTGLTSSNSFTYIKNGLIQNGTMRASYYIDCTLNSCEMSGGIQLDRCTCSNLTYTAGTVLYANDCEFTGADFRGLDRTDINSSIFNDTLYIESNSSIIGCVGTFFNASSKSLIILNSNTFLGTGLGTPNSLENAGFVSIIGNRILASIDSTGSINIIDLTLNIYS